MKRWRDIYNGTFPQCYEIDLGRIATKTTLGRLREVWPTERIHFDMEGKRLMNRAYHAREAGCLDAFEVHFERLVEYLKKGHVTHG